MIHSCKKPPVYFPTVTGDICSFNSQYAGLPLKSCISQIQGYQEGSGTPSPDNVRPLHAFSSGTLTANSNTYTFTFGQSIYQGYIDWLRGVVVGTHKYIEFNGGAGETWYFGSALPTSNRAYISVSDAKANSLDIASNYFKPSEATAGTGWEVPLTAYINSNKFFMCFFDVNDTNVYDLASWKTYLNTHTLQVAYELATPIEIPLGGIQLLTQNQNNIFANCGDTTLEYLKAGR